MKDKNILQWFATVRSRPVPKFIVGLRGTGKTEALKAINAQLQKEGVPEAQRLFIDSSDLEIRRIATGQALLEHLYQRIPGKRKTHILIREAALLPDAAVVIGALAADRNLNLVATTSSLRLLNRGLTDYLGRNFELCELLPPERQRPYSAEAARVRWNEIFISDVLEPNIVLETGLLNRAVFWLSDHIGDSLSLRIIAKAISPCNRVLSPHTIERYLTTLEDSHLIEKAFCRDRETGRVSKRNYKYFFTDPALRTALFGAAPDDEERRAALNRAWFLLRHRGYTEIYSTIHDRKVDFLTRSGKDVTAWSVTPDGTPVELK